MLSIMVINVLVLFFILNKIKNVQLKKEHTIMVRNIFKLMEVYNYIFINFKQYFSKK